MIPMGTVPMGTVVAFALPKENIPPGWLPCDGSEIPPEYENFIRTLGSNCTPNLAGRTIIGTGVPSTEIQTDGRDPHFDPSNNWPLGYTGGEYKHILTEAEMPAHSHGYTYENPIGEHPGDFYSGSYWQPTTVNSTTAITGGNQPHFNMQPYQAFYYIIYTGQED